MNPKNHWPQLLRSAVSVCLLSLLAVACEHKEPEKPPEKVKADSDCPKAQKVIDVCEASFDANKDDAVRFVQAVSKALGSNIPQRPDLNANCLIEFLEDGGTHWKKIRIGDACCAKGLADDGGFVIAAMISHEFAPPAVEPADHIRAAQEYGHVAVVVSRPLDPNGATGYWGSNVSTLAQKNMPLTKFWQQEDLPNIRYYVISFDDKTSCAPSPTPSVPEH